MGNAPAVLIVQDLAHDGALFEAWAFSTASTNRFPPFLFQMNESFLYLSGGACGRCGKSEAFSKRWWKTLQRRLYLLTTHP